MQKLVSIINGIIVAMFGVSIAFNSMAVFVSALVIATISAIVLKEFREQF